MTDESGHSSMEILLGVIKLKTEAFLKLVTTVKHKVQPENIDMKSEQQPVEPSASAVSESEDIEMTEEQPSD